MADKDLALMAHLMRRAGFGAPRDELEARVAIGYEATVEELLHPEDQEPVDDYEFLRYHPSQWKPGTLGGVGQSGWVYRMIKHKGAPSGKNRPLLAPSIRHRRLEGRPLARGQLHGRDVP